MEAKMYEAVAVFVLVFLVAVSGNNFPPVINPPPILTQSVKVLDLPSQKSFVQEQVGVASSPKGEDVFLSGELQNFKSTFVDQRFIPEAQISEKQIISSAPSKDISDNYYNSYPAIGPVATPRPDEADGIYPAQIVKIPSQVAPEPATGYWIITSRPDVKDISAQRVFKVSDAGKGLEGLKTLQSTVAKSSGPPADPDGFLQQFWLSGEPQSEYRTVDGLLHSRSQLVDGPYPGYKQVPAPEITKEYVAALIPEVPKPAPGPVFKSIDTIPVSDIPSSEIPENAGWLVTKDGIVSQVRHIWVPTSRDSGQFITVPKNGVIESPQLLVPKGVPKEAPQPATVLSDTWVLKQDDVYPRFERQSNTLFPAVTEISKEKVSLQKSPPLEESNSKIIPVMPKSVNPVAPYGFPWIVSMASPELKQTVLPALTITPAAENVDSEAHIPVQKAYGPLIPSPKALIPPVAVNEPCPKDQIALQSPLKTVIFSSIPQQQTGVRKPLFNRVVQFNSAPNSFYVLNSAVRPNLYAYGRRSSPAASRNTVVRFVSTNPVNGATIVAPLSPAKSVPFRSFGYYRNTNPWSYLRTWRPLLVPNLFNSEPTHPDTPDVSSKEGSGTSKESSEAPPVVSGEAVEAPEAKEVEIERELPAETESAKLEETAETVLRIQTSEQGVSEENELNETKAVDTVDADKEV